LSAAGGNPTDSLVAPRPRRRRLGDYPYLAKWLIIGAATGTVAGLGALGLQALVSLITDGVLGGVAGYRPARPSGEGGFEPASGFRSPWLIPLVVAVGGLVSSLLVRRVAPEAAGHGTDRAINAANRDPTGMRARVPAIKLLASGTTLGTGGSGGTEGPVAQISAGLASLVARRFRLTYADARIALAAGLAAGIGAIFHTPVGAAVLGAELLVLYGLVWEALPPALISTGVSWLIFISINEPGPFFGNQSAASLGGPGAWVLVAALGLATGVVGRLYAWTFYAIDSWLERQRPTWVWSLLGGLAVGLLSLAVPGVLGTSYGIPEQVMDREFLLGASVWLVVAIPFAKIIATSVSIGSGGSAGVFGPGILIGAGVGAASWRLCEPLGIAGSSPMPFVIIGMAACLGPIIHAPLAVVVMVWETTHATGLLPGVVLATLIATAVVGPRTIYHSQLATVGGPQSKRLTGKIHAELAGERFRPAAEEFRRILLAKIRTSFRWRRKHEHIAVGGHLRAPGKSAVVEPRIHRGVYQRRASLGENHPAPEAGKASTAGLAAECTNRDQTTHHARDHAATPDTADRWGKPWST
jgi:CIC family chloride channel protein